MGLVVPPSFLPQPACRCSLHCHITFSLALVQSQPWLQPGFIITRYFWRDENFPDTNLLGLRAWVSSWILWGAVGVCVSSESPLSTLGDRAGSP